MRLGLHVEIAGDVEQAVEHPANGHFLHRQPTHWLTHRAQCGRELCDIVVRRDIARLEMDFGDALIIAGDEAVENLCEPYPRTAIDAAHDAEIDRGDASVRKREQIPLVHVRVEEPVGDCLAQKGADQLFGERGGIMAGGDQRGAVRQLDAVDPFQRQHLARGALPVDPGHDEIGLGGHAVGQL